MRQKPEVTLDLGSDTKHSIRVVWSEWDPTSNRLELCVSVDDVSSPTAVGQAYPMPEAEAFTMAVFKASDVPPGTNLYITKVDK